VEPLRIGAAEVRHPVVIGAAGRHGESRIFVVAIDQVEGRVEEGNVDALLVEHFDPRVRIPTARQDVFPGGGACAFGAEITARND
jgi:tRNA A58 N-methylase Trm61